MGQPVVHFEVIGKDGDKMNELLLGAVRVGVRPDGPTDTPSRRPTAGREPNDEGVGIGGGVAPGRGLRRSRHLLRRGARRRGLAGQGRELGGSRIMGPEEMGEVGITIGLFTDPEGHVIGVVK